MSLLPEINQASAEINKFVAQANIHQTIAPVNPAEFTSPADTLLLASRDPVIREVSVGMTGVEAVQRTVSGTPPLSLPNSLGKPLKAWEVDVLPYQEGTGYPSPSNVRPIHGTDKLTITTAGKNLCPDLLYQSSTQAVYLGQDNNIDFPLSLVGGQQYTLSYETTNTHQINVYLREEHDSGGTVIGTDSPVSFAPPTTGKYRIALHIVAGLSVDDVSHVQLEFGSTASGYTPYVAPSQTAITLPQTVYTGTIGSDGGESRSAELTVNNAKTINYSGAGSVPYVWLAFQVGKAGNADTQGNCITSMYAMSNSTFYDKHAKMYGTGIEIYDSDFTDRETALALLTNFVAVYKLKNPQTFPLTAPTIPTPNGSATTWATAEDGTVDGMEVTYIKSE